MNVFSKWFSWPRLFCLFLTAALFVIIFRQIDFSTFWQSLKKTRPGWFLLGFLAYGVSLWLGAMRWHFALKLVDRTVHVSASARLYLIGHFFFVVLFGGIGGDLAKSAVYSRYFRFGLPELISAALLDRVFGFGGNLMLALLLIMLTFWTGGFAFLRKFEVDWPGAWVVAGIILAAIALVFLIFWRPQGESSWARMVRALRSGGGRLVWTPNLALPGMLIAFIAITVFSSIFAFNVRAVVSEDVPWMKFLWTFPFIMAIGTIPFTVAGAGVREVAALTVLPLYGVPPGDCLAAGLLTLVQKLAWAGIGGAKLWREESLFAKNAVRPVPESISVIMPALNEAGSLPETIRCVRAIPEVGEVILVDGGSQDATRAIAKELGCRVLESPPGRGKQLRLGGAQASGDVILFLHADTWLPSSAGHAALNCLRDTSVVAGGFWKMFRPTPILLLGSRWKCAVRLYVARRIAGDQALFVRRTVLEQIGGVPDMPLMEEFELCRQLRKHGRLALAGATLATSPRRFQKHGYFRTTFRMWLLSFLYRLGRSPQDLSKLYDRD